MRVILGLIKGGLCGGAVGYGAHALGIGAGGALAFAVYAVLGFLVGIVCGKPIWRQETLWTPAIKGVFGAAICVGLYFGASKLLAGVGVPGAAALGLPSNTSIASVPMVLGPIIAVLYGIFVEVDDGGPAGAPAAVGGAGKGASADAPDA